MMERSRGGSTFTLSATKRIASDLREIKKYPIEGVAVEASPDEMGRWTIFMEGPKATPFEGGIYELELLFPHDYPNAPPNLVFKSQFWHPNVYPDGRVCISILHAAGDDEQSGESYDIRWKPINSVSSVLNSVMLMLMEPNFSSPANVDASVEWRKEPEKYVASVKALAAKAQDKFLEHHSDVWIPHPDTNPDERAFYSNADAEENKMTNIEVWDSDSGEADEWGSSNQEDDEVEEE